MMSNPATNLLTLPLIGILRGCAAEHLPQVVASVLKGGMLNLEITMNSPGAEEQIRQAVRCSEGLLNIGAGTVTSVQILDRALAAGASFIVTPSVATDVVRQCVADGIPVFPGAFSPSEIHAAWELGATMVKIFPAEFGGVTFIRAMKGPFPDIPLMPTGGVTSDNIRALLQAGGSGFGIGSPLFQKERLDSQDWPWLENQVRAFVNAFRAAPPRA